MSWGLNAVTFDVSYVLEHFQGFSRPLLCALISFPSGLVCLFIVPELAVLPSIVICLSGCWLLP